MDGPARWSEYRSSRGGGMDPGGCGVLAVVAFISFALSLFVARLLSGA